MDYFASQVLCMTINQSEGFILIVIMIIRAGASTRQRRTTDPPPPPWRVTLCSDQLEDTVKEDTYIRKLRMNKSQDVSFALAKAKEKNTLSILYTTQCLKSEKVQRRYYHDIMFKYLNSH